MEAPNLFCTRNPSAPLPCRCGWALVISGARCVDTYGCVFLTSSVEKLGSNTLLIDMLETACSVLTAVTVRRPRLCCRPYPNVLQQLYRRCVACLNPLLLASLSHRAA